MQAYTYVLHRISKNKLVIMHLMAFIIFCLVSNIWTVYHFVHASSSEYSLVSSNIALDGTSDATIVIPLKTSVARSYVAIQGTWSTNETAQTSYFGLSSISRGGSAPMTFGANGTCAWTPETGNGMSVASGGEVLSATYTVNKDTPAGTYAVSFSNGLFTYDINGADVDENDVISSIATITVTRSDPVNSDAQASHSDPTEPSSHTDRDAQANPDASTNHDGSSDHKPSADQETTTNSGTIVEHIDSLDRNQTIDDSTRPSTTNSDASIVNDYDSSNKSSNNIGIAVAAAIITSCLTASIFIIYRKKSRKNLPS